MDGIPPVWTEALRDLWRRIDAHDFAPPTPFNFTARLARDHGWPIGLAQAAIAEYRRFAFLCVARPTPSTPSEEVDEVWHLHLAYTRDYWDRWCGQALQTPLHHDPTPGGPAATTTYRAQYAATLAAYETWFGPAPEALWPATHRRFAARPRYRTIDAARTLAITLPWRR